MTQKAGASKVAAVTLIQNIGSKTRQTYFAEEKIRLQIVALQNRYWAAAIDMHAQIKQANWNVRGPAIIAVHKLFDTVSEDVEIFQI